MSIFKRKKTKLEQEIELLLEVMRGTDPTSDGYTTMTKNLEILCKAKDSNKSPSNIWSTVIVVTGSLVEVVLMLNYEKLGVIASKVMSRILKGRV